MTTLSSQFDDDNQSELEKEFQKLALLVPTIPRNRYLTELEFLEFVIGYIQQLQELLSTQCLNHLKSSFISSTNLLMKTDRHPLSPINLESNLPH